MLGKLTKKFIQEYKFFRKIINNLNVIIYYNEMRKDGTLKLLWANSQVPKIMGYTLKERMEMEPNYYKEKYHPDDYPTIVPQMWSFFFKKTKHTKAFLYRVKHKDGNWHWLYSTGRVVERNKEKGYARGFCLAIDMTDKIVENEDRLQVLLKENARLKNKLELSKLTPAEKQIIVELTKGKSTQEIAELLNRSYQTINNHKRHIFKKLEIHKLTDLVAFAKESGLS